MNKRFLVLAVILLILIMFFYNFDGNKTATEFNPLELEIGDTFNYINSEENRIVLNYEIGDVTGDKENDLIIVIGESNEENQMNKNIDAIIYDIKNNRFYNSNIKKYEGNLPKIHLNDIDGDNIDDVIVIVDLENVGQKMRIISFNGIEAKEIFGEKESNGLEISGSILDGFKANMKIKRIKNEITIDLSNNKENYIASGFYMENGKLKTDKINVTSAGISNIEFVLLDNKVGIKFVERVRGFDNLDIIEQIDVLMKYENGNWIILEIKGEKSGVL